MLVISGVEKVHFSTCIDAVCPFENKYKKTIEKKCPDVDIIMGTHGDDTKEFKEEVDVFKGMIKNSLSRPKATMETLYREAHK